MIAALIPLRGKGAPARRRRDRLPRCPRGGRSSARAIPSSPCRAPTAGWSSWSAPSSRAGDAPVLLIDEGDGVAEKAARRLGGARLQRCEHRRRRRARLGGGRPDALQGRQRALQDARRAGRGRLAPGDPRCRDLADAGAAKGGDFCFFDARPAAEYEKMHVPGRGLPSERRARPPLPRRRPGRRHARRRQLRRTHARHRRGDRPEARRHPQPGLRTGERHAGLGARRGGAAARRPGGALSRAFRSRDGRRAAAAPRPSAKRWHIPRIDHGDARIGSGPNAAARRISSTCARRRNFPPAICPAPSTRRAARSSRRRINGSACSRARVVLVDDTGLRAAFAAFWLRQLGWETCVLQMPPNERAPSRMAAVPHRRSHQRSDAFPA